MFVLMGALDAPGMSNPITDRTWYDEQAADALSTTSKSSHAGAYPNR
jgi:hypothetical protein